MIIMKVSYASQGLVIQIFILTLKIDFKVISKSSTIINWKFIFSLDIIILRKNSNSYCLLDFCHKRIVVKIKHV